MYKCSFKSCLNNNIIKLQTPFRSGTFAGVSYSKNFATSASNF